MSIVHAFSNTIPDATGTVTVWNGATTASVAASDIVKPSDWNSGHNQLYTLSGNTTNASTASGTNVVLAASGAVTLGGSTNTIVISSPQFTNSNHMTFGTNGGVVTGSFNPINIGMSTNGNTAGTTGTFDGAGLQYILAGGNNVTLSQSSDGSSVTLSIHGAAGGGGGGVTVSDYVPAPLGNNTIYTSWGQNTLHFMGFTPPDNITMTCIAMLASFNTASSSNSNAVSETMSYGFYVKGSNTNSSRYELAATSSASMAVSYSSNLSGGATFAAGGATFTTTSAGTGVGSLISGQKSMVFPFATSLVAGSDYLVCFAHSTASTGGLSAMRLSYMNISNMSNASIGRIANNTIALSATSNTLSNHVVIYSATSNAWPTNVARSQLSVMSGYQMGVTFEA